MLVDLYGETGLREMERQKELAHARELAAIRRGDSAAPIPQSAPAEPVQSRRAFVEPILAAKGWSILDWANEAGVSSSAAHDYLADRRRQFASTRLKLANALGISIQQLP